MNKTEVVVKVSFPIVLATGYICYKIGQYTTYVKFARFVMENEKNKNSKD